MNYCPFSLAQTSRTFAQRRLALGGMLVVLHWVSASALGLNRDQYMGVDELEPGMTGVGRTVMAGTEIQEFNFEIIDVLRNAYYPKQDIILVRCSGLNLEHSGIIGGMSGSPCYVVDDTGNERLIGAVAYGWTFNKDPTCGLQPIEQMLAVGKYRDPKLNEDKGSREVQADASRHAKGAARRKPGGRGIDLGELVATTWSQRIPDKSNFALFNDDLRRLSPPSSNENDAHTPLRRLLTPVMVAGASERTLKQTRGFFDRLQMEPVASGGVRMTNRNIPDDVELAPGSALCIPFMRGDIEMSGFGTCTVVDGDRIYGFGHPMDGKGLTHLPMATGVVHTVIASVMRSNKIGSALDVVGTLWGDESAAIAGTIGASPNMVPLTVVVDHNRGRQTFDYRVVQDSEITPILLAIGTADSIFAYSSLPEENTIRYDIAVEFEDLGTLKSSNFASQSRGSGPAVDVALPTMSLMNSPFGEPKVKRAEVKVTVEPQANLARFDEVTIERDTYKPGETVIADVRWMHWRGDPTYTHAQYSLTLPDDIPDGEYKIVLASGGGHLTLLRAEKPYLFRADTLEEQLERFNLIGSARNNRLYMRLTLPEGGVAVDSTPMPDLPSFQAKIIADTGRDDLSQFRDAVVEEYETDFEIDGGETITITVDRRMGQP